MRFETYLQLCLEKSDEKNIADNTAFCQNARNTIGWGNQERQGHF
jgi:hypothetical protein